MNQPTAAVMLLEARHSARLRQIDLSAHSGVHHKQIGSYEQRRSGCKADVWIALMNACGYRVVALPMGSNAADALEPRKRGRAVR